MSGREDHRLVEHLYDELSTADEQAFERLLAEDEAVSAELVSLESTLSALREALPAEEPAAHLDAKIMAYARQAAELSEASEAGFGVRLRKWLRGPGLGLIAAASAAAIAAFVILPRMSAPSFDAQTVAFESAPSSPALRPAAEPALKIEAEKPAELGFGGAGEQEAATETVNAARDTRERSKRKVVDKLAKEMDGWEGQAATGKGAPAAVARGGDDADRRVVVQFPAPAEEARADSAKKADATDMPRRAPAKSIATPEEDAPLVDDAFGEAVAALPAEPAPAAAPTPPAAPTAARPRPAPAARFNADAKLAEKKASNDAVVGGAPPPPLSPARRTLGAARASLAAGDLPAADRLARQGVAQAQNTPERPWALLEAAEILYAAGNFALAEQYASQASPVLAAEARPRADRLVERARAKRAAPPAATDSR